MNKTEKPKVAKPKVQVKKRLDWVQLAPWLRDQGLKVDDVMYALEPSGNGCEIDLELYDADEDYVSADVMTLTKFLFENFPWAVVDDLITIWFWW